MPKDGKVILPFVLQLMTWNNFITGVTHFSIDNAHERVFFALRRPVKDLDYSEPKNAVEQVSTIAVNSLLLLRQRFPI